MRMKYQKENGFTLIEMVVVMAIFLLVIGVALTIFLTIFQHQKDTLDQQKMLNQMSYAEEFMSKALRMARDDTSGSCISAGYIYQLTRPDITSGFYQGVKFVNQSDNNACTEFFLKQVTLPSGTTVNELEELRNSTNDADAVPITSDSMQINYIKFAVNGTIATTASGITGAEDTQLDQPLLTILVSSQIIQNSDLSPTITQTSVSERNINVLQ